MMLLMIPERGTAVLECALAMYGRQTTMNASIAKEIRDVVRDHLARDDYDEIVLSEPDADAAVRLFTDAGELARSRSEAQNELRNVRAELQALRERSRAMTEAMGLASTAVPDMAIDVENPLSMAQRVVDEVEVLRGRLNAAVEALQWCSGSADFGEGGHARKGWLAGPQKILDVHIAPAETP